MLRSFRDALTADVERLAAVLTSETGKPIRQARNEINGLPARIDFFLESTEATIAARDVHNAAGMREQISHEPLGVIANISAWNYPYFVGGNVFVPALLTGNAVLYKPSEFATLTGIEIGKLLHRSGVPQPVFAVLIGDGAVGAELIKQPIDGVFFTGSYATGQRIARELGPRMVKLQLELGGKDPIYVREDVDVAKGRGVARRRRDVQHRAELLLGRAHLCASNDLRRFRQRVRQGSRGLQDRRSGVRDHLHRSDHARTADRSARTASRRRRRQGREACPRRRSRSATRQLVRADGADRMSIIRWK